MADDKTRFKGTSLPKSMRREAKKEMSRLGEELVVRAEMARIWASLNVMVEQNVNAGGLKADRQLLMKKAQSTFVDAGERLFELLRKQS
jgi:hypothetical protein